MGSNWRQGLILGVLLTTVGCPSMGEAQERGWFSPRRTITKVLELKSLVVTSTPSSCVAVQTSLPPCRHIRHIDVAPSRPSRIHATRGPEMVSPPQQVKLEASPSGASMNVVGMGVGPSPTQGAANSGLPSWISFFGLQDLTVTNTVFRPFTKTVTDPNTVVTFSVKGCHPSRLPFDLGPCEEVLDQVKEGPTLPKLNEPATTKFVTFK